VIWAPKSCTNGNDHSLESREDEFGLFPLANKQKRPVCGKRRALPSLRGSEGRSIKTLLIYRLAAVFQENFRIKLSSEKVIEPIESYYSILECDFFPYL
jgi:hypothetical protein